MARAPKADDAQVIETALQRFYESADATSEQRQRETDALNFEFDPWPEAAKNVRGAYTLAGVNVPARPMLNIPLLDQPLQLVINQEKAAHLGITVHPETEDADDDTAEINQGIIRHIETRSRANLARSWAFERQVRCGRGYYEIRKRYARPNAKGPEAFDQELYIARIQNQFCVYDDPWALEPDYSDRLFAFKIVDLPHDRYAQAVGKQGELAGLSRKARADRYQDITNHGALFSSIGDNPPEWVTDTYCRIAEYWTVETSTESVTVGKETREVETRTVLWRKINGVEILEEQEWDGQYIPLIFLPGREYHINGKRIFQGIIGPAMDPARLVNYTASNIAEKIATGTKASWVLAEGQEEGHEAEFVRATIRPVPFVRYKPKTVNDELAPEPKQNLLGPDIAGDVLAMEQFKQFVQAGTFTFDPSLGNLPSKDRSGKAILAQQQQADASNSHYLDNLGEISMPYEARVLLDLIPKVYDRPGRLQEIINGKDERRKIIIGQPFYAEPESEKPIPVEPGAATPQGVKIEHYDLTKGEYGVTVSVGKSYQTKMQQGLDTLGQLIQAEPDLLPVLGYRWMEYNDNIPGHKEIAEDLKKLRPPQLQDDEDGSPEKLKQQLAQLGQQHDLLVKELDAKTKVIETDQVKQQAQVQMKDLETKAKVAMQQMQDATTIRVAEINAAVKGYQVEAQHAAEHEALALGQAHESTEAERTRQHTSAEAAANRQHEAATTAAGAGADAAQSAQEHDQSLEAGEMDHQRALEQGEQAGAQQMELAQANNDAQADGA